MDGKYSKYIPSSYGFITKLEIVGDMLHVHTKETSKGESHKYPLAEKITEFSERLENQYKLITEENNLQVIKKDLTKDANKIFNAILIAISLPTTLAVIALTVILSEIMPIFLGLGVIGLSLVSKKTLISLITKDFDDEMDMVKTYLSSRIDIEKMNELDPNVTGNLKSTTVNRIEINNELSKNSMIPETFDITLLDDLMSKVKTKKELKKLLTNYMICVALRQPQVFVNPNEESEQQVTFDHEPKIVKSKYEYTEESVEIEDAHTRGRRPNNK